MRKDFYIYLHKTLDGQPFYIGRGCGYRAYRRSGRSKDWNEKSKDGFTVEILVSDLTENEAYNNERLYITKVGRADKQKGSLINKTDGGGGGTTGRIVTEEEKIKISNTLKMKYKDGTLKQDKKVKVKGPGKGKNSPYKNRFRVDDSLVSEISKIEDYKVACERYNICPATFYKMKKKSNDI